MLDRVLGREARPQVPLATTDGLAGFDATQVLTIVGAGAGDEAGALRKLAQRGADVGADAVVGVRVECTAAGSFWMQSRHTFAYGTAVRTRPAPALPRG